MNRPLTHLIINTIDIEDNITQVGATDNERWRWDIEEGMSGVDAKTIVYVTLTDHGKGYAVSEEAGFHASPKDPVRKLAMSYLPELFEVAWTIKKEKLNLEYARKKFFGLEIGK